MSRKTRSAYIVARANIDGLLPSRDSANVSVNLATKTKDDTHTQIKHSTTDIGRPSQKSIRQPTRPSNIGVVNVSSDLWSAAYREAIDSLGNDLDVAILKGSNAAQLLKRLEDIDKDVEQDSAFRRGMEYLHSIQVPLERFKVALDLAAPLSKIDPTASTVVGVISSVTAVSWF